jgi:ubiquinone/menaquinone biosynthesis C-methylase UbiE
VKNYFESRLSARRYAIARPAIHNAALSGFFERTGLGHPLPRGLDVGCGTGQSALALADVAADVVAIDPSAAMLSQCVPHNRITYLRAAAEELPVRNGAFDIITAGQAFHWFDQDTFQAEARRALSDRGWLVIYNSWFTAEMKEEATFADWCKRDYLARYPTPPRNRTPISDEWAYSFGFSLVHQAPFTIEIPMSVGQFSDYTLSTSNVIAAVGESATAFEEAERWIVGSIAPFFDGETRTLIFAGRSVYLRKGGL